MPGGLPLLPGSSPKAWLLGPLAPLDVRTDTGPGERALKCLCPKGFTHHSSRAFFRKGFLLLLMTGIPTGNSSRRPICCFDKCLSSSPAQEPGPRPGAGGCSHLGFSAKDEAAGPSPRSCCRHWAGAPSSSLRFVPPQPPACSSGSQPCSLLKCLLAWTCGHTLCQCLWVTFLAAEGQGWCPPLGDPVSDPALWLQGGALPDNTQLYVNIPGLSGGVGCTHSPQAALNVYYKALGEGHTAPLDSVRLILEME